MKFYIITDVRYEGDREHLKIDCTKKTHKDCLVDSKIPTPKQSSILLKLWLP